MFNERWWENHVFTYGSVSEGVIWKQVYSEYKADRLASAHELAMTLGVHSSGQGVDFQRMLEAELETRKRSFWEEQGPSLSLEMSQSFPQERWEQLRNAAQEAFAATAQALGFSETPPVLVTLILQELDTPWTPGRFGYYASKAEYHKICLPDYLLDRPAELAEALKHEYSHAISATLTQETCPTWLDEAIAMAVSGSVSVRYRDDLAAGKAAWLEAEDLDLAFAGAIGDEQEGPMVQRAYEQASWIGAYLVSLKGTQGLGDLLRAFGDNSFWGELKLRMLGMQRSEEAMHQNYGISVSEAFAKAREYMGTPSQK